MDDVFIVVADNEVKFIGSKFDCEEFELEHPDLTTAFYKVNGAELDAGSKLSGIRVTLLATYSAYGE